MVVMMMLLMLRRLWLFMFLVFWGLMLAMVVPFIKIVVSLYAPIATH